MKKVNNFMFWLKNQLFRQKTMRKYRELLQNQELDEKSLAELNWEKRKAIVNHAYQNTKFYKKFYDLCGFNPSMLVTENDWDKVPVLERTMIRENLDDMIMRNISHKRLRVSTTGGSTGHPLKVYHDKAFDNEILAWRYLGWWNVSPADNQGTIHRAIPATTFAKFKNMIMWFPTKRIFLNASSFTDNDIEFF